METSALYTNVNDPEKWLFPGKKENTHLTIRNVEKILEDAVKKVGITKEVSVHSLVIVLPRTYWKVA